ncbi:MAG: AtpZ/AtpI family protein [Steroidobacteraceae bacterium]
MTDTPRKPIRDQRSFGEQIGASVARKLKARRNPAPGLWFGLGAMGVIGWSVAVPALMGAALGSWLDSHHWSKHSWTLALLVAGLSIGCLNAGYWVAKEAHTIQDNENDDHA